MVNSTFSINIASQWAHDVGTTFIGRDVGQRIYNVFATLDYRRRKDVENWRLYDVDTTSTI